MCNTPGAGVGTTKAPLITKHLFYGQQRSMPSLARYGLHTTWYTRVVQYEDYRMQGIDYLIRTEHGYRNWWEQRATLKGSPNADIFANSQNTPLLIFTPSPLLLLIFLSKALWWQYIVLFYSRESALFLILTWAILLPALIFNFLVTLGWASYTFVHYQVVLNSFFIPTFSPQLVSFLAAAVTATVERVYRVS